MLKEILTRSSGGITVTLLVEITDDYTRSGKVKPKAQYGVITVESPSENFTFNEIPLNLAADVYWHPYSYASYTLKSGRLERETAAV